MDAQEILLQHKSGVPRDGLLALIRRDPATGNMVDVIGESIKLTDSSGNGNDAEVFGYAATFDGVKKLTGTQILGTETVVGQSGTSTLAVGTGEITATAGHIAWFQLSDGRKYLLQSASDSGQVKFFNVLDPNDFLTMTGGTPHCTTKIPYPQLPLYGFSQTADGFVPARQNHTLERGGTGYLRNLNAISTCDEETWTSIQTGQPITPSTENVVNGSGTIHLRTVTTSEVSAIYPTDEQLGANDVLSIGATVGPSVNAKYRCVIWNADKSQSVAAYLDWGGGDWRDGSKVWEDLTRADFVVSNVNWNWETSVIAYISIGIYYEAGCDIWVDVIAKNPRSRPKLVFTFDDGSESDYTVAYPYMSARGMLGTSFLISSQIGTANKMTTSQLDEMYAAGWELGNHTATHPNLSTLTKEQQRTELLTCANWLIDNGYPARAKYVALPTGNSNAETREVFAEEEFVATRTSRQRMWNNAVMALNPYIISQTLSMSSATTVADITGAIDEAIATGKTTIINCHTLVASNPGTYSWLISDFQTVIDYAKGKSDLGLIDIMPFGAWADGLSAVAQSGIDCEDNALGVQSGWELTRPCVINMPTDDQTLLDADQDQLNPTDLLNTPVVGMTTTGTIVGNTVECATNQYILKTFAFVNGDKYRVTYNGTGTCAHREDTGGYSASKTLPVVIDFTASADTRVQATATGVAGATFTGVLIQKFNDPFWFDGSDSPNDISLEDLEAFPDGDLNDQYIFGTRGLALYESPRNASDLARAKRALKTT